MAGDCTQGAPELPGGKIEVSRGGDDKVILSFLGADGSFHWFKVREDEAARRLARQLEAVATRATDHA